MAALSYQLNVRNDTGPRQSREVVFFGRPGFCVPAKNTARGLAQQSCGFVVLVHIVDLGPGNAESRPAFEDSGTQQGPCPWSGPRGNIRTASDILVAGQKTGQPRPSPQEPREVCPKRCKQGIPYVTPHFEADESILYI